MSLNDILILKLKIVSSTRFAFVVPRWPYSNPTFRLLKIPLVGKPTPKDMPNSLMASLEITNPNSSYRNPAL